MSSNAKLMKMEGERATKGYVSAVPYLPDHATDSGITVPCADGTRGKLGTRTGAAPQPNQRNAWRGGP